jgi:hypothetical protein
MAPLAAIGAAIGSALSGVTAAGAATAIGAASAAVAAGTSIAAATRKEPKLRIEAPPTAAKAAEAMGAERNRIRRGLSFDGTIMAGALNNTTSGGKTLTGQ